MEGGGWTEGFFVSLGGPQTHDFSGPTARGGRRDDNFVLSMYPAFPGEVRGTADPSASTG
jgi:hypothetical protein